MAPDRIAPNSTCSWDRWTRNNNVCGKLAAPARSAWQRSDATQRCPFQGLATGTSQAPDLLDRPVHRLHDRLALGIDPWSLPASGLAGHVDRGIRILGQRSPCRQRLSVGQASRGDGGRCPERRRPRRCPRSSSPHPSSSQPVVQRRCSDALHHRLQVLSIRRLIAHAYRHDQLMIGVDGRLARCSPADRGPPDRSRWLSTSVEP